MRSTLIMIAVLLAASALLFGAVGCKQQAGDESADATPPEEHGEAASPIPGEEGDTPSAEAQGQAMEPGSVDPTKHYAMDEMNTLSYIASTGSAAEKARALAILSEILATNENTEVRRDAASALTGFPNEAMDVLTETALHDPDMDVRQACLNALSGADMSAELMASLNGLRNTNDATLRMAALQAQMGLHLNSDDRAAGLSWVAGQLGSQRDDVSAQAMMKLEQQGPKALPACIEVLKTSPDANARQAAACVIGLVCAGTNPSQQKFAEMSKATHKKETIAPIREANMAGLEPLESALANDPSPKVRAVAAQGLGYLGQESSVPLLAEALHDDNDEVRWWAATALITVPAQAAVSDLCGAAMDDDVSRVRRAAVRALGWVEATPEVTAAMVDATRDANAEVRRTAANALGHLSSPHTLDALAGLLDDGDEDVRWAAVVAIGELRDPEAAPLLVSVVRDANPMVANAAERALQKMGIAQRRFGTRDEG